MKASFNRENIYLLVILSASFFFRFCCLSHFSLSNDELSAIHRLDFQTFGDLINYGVRPDGHPALAQLLMWLWTSVFGLSPAAVRFPFVFISSAAPLFAYLFMKNISGKAPALFLAAAIALLPFPLLYGRLARPYGIGLTFVLYTAWLWTEMLLKTHAQRKRNAVAIALAIGWALCLYTHYFAALTATVIGLTGLFFMNKKNRKQYLLSALLAVLLFLPHLSLTFHQISLGGVGQWLAKPQAEFVWKHIKLIFGNSLIIFILLLLSPKDFSNTKDKYFIKIRLALLLWFALPLIIGYLYSKYVNAVLQNSVLIFSMPFLLAFTLSFNYKHLGKFNKIALIIFTVTTAFSLIYPENFYKKQHFGEFARTPIVLNKIQEKYGKEKILNIVDINHRSYLDYYLARHKINIEYLNGKFDTDSSLINLKKIIDGYSKPYITFSDMQNTSSFIAKSIIMSKFGKLKSKKTFGERTSIFLFSKDSACCKTDNLPIYDKEYCCDTLLGVNNKTASELFVHYLIKTASEQTKLNLVFDIVDKNGKSVHWQSLPLRYLINNQGFVNVVIMKKIKPRKNYDKIKIYIWNREHENFGCKKIGTNCQAF